MHREVCFAELSFAELSVRYGSLQRGRQSLLPEASLGSFSLVPKANGTAGGHSPNLLGDWI